MAHVKEVSAGNKGKSLKEILKMAKKTYKKSPATKVAKHKKHKKHKKYHTTKRHHKKHKRGRRGRKKQRGGEHNDAAQMQEQPPLPQPKEEMLKHLFPEPLAQFLYPMEVEIPHRQMLLCVELRQMLGCIIYRR